MSETSTGQDPSVEGLLLPLAEGNLLLPSAVVVELLGYPETVTPGENTPDWLAGRFDWRGLSLPLVSWDYPAEQAGSARGLRKHIVVCHLFSTGDGAPFAGLEITGLPRRVSVTKADLQVRAGSADPKSCILAEARVHDSLVRIPDLDALGRMLLPFPG